MPQPFGYVPVGDYAVIGNCRTAALVSRAGSIDWLCLPHFSAPSLFAALLDQRRGGRFSITPRRMHESTRTYMGDSAVLQTTHHCADGVVTVTDAMTMLPDEEACGALQPQHELLRLVECTQGEVVLDVLFEPRPGYGTRRPHLRHRGRLGWLLTDEGAAMYLYGDAALETEADKDRLSARVTLRKGQSCRLVLSYGGRGICALSPLEETRHRIDSTIAWWETWMTRCSYRGRYRPRVVRSCLTLKMLTYRLSGAIIAAVTTSLPVHDSGDRNWDYRYCWLRDTSMLLQSFIDLGFRVESAAFIDWLLHATRLTRPHVEVMYDVHGNAAPGETEARMLEGYRGRGPVRLGNAAGDQLQLDIYGEVLLAVRRFVEHGGHLDTRERHLLLDLGEAVRRCWRMPDNGIWEIRLPRRHNTHSKLMCWVALDALLALHGQLDLALDEAAYRQERDEIRADIDAHGFDPQLQSYVGYYGAKAPDASLLLLARYGYIAADDPRMLSTWAYIEQELATGDGLLYRYPPGSEYDGVGGADEPFLLCSFWQVDYLARIGEIDRAREIFERLSTLGNDLDLFAEGFDPDNGEPAGNFPQAFSHVGLVIAALALDQHEGRQA